MHSEEEAGDQKPSMLRMNYSSRGTPGLPPELLLNTS